eukprot:558189-Alexandrium_andersonii.AAC.1
MVVAATAETGSARCMRAELAVRLFRAQITGVFGSLRSDGLELRSPANLAGLFCGRVPRSRVVAFH